MKILLLEPYFGGSHRQWAEGLLAHSKHEVKVYSLPGSHWKWRLHGGAITFAERFLADNYLPDLILATDMLDFSTFLGLAKEKAAGVKTAIYFHENQLAYPWSPTDQDVKERRDNHYKFINYTSALVADKVFFNSAYNRTSFFTALKPFLKAFPDHQNKHTLDLIADKSEVLFLGLDLQKFDSHEVTEKRTVPTLLWNHRWEYDKNPKLFFETLFDFKAQGLDFNLIILGQSYKKSPDVFEKAKSELSERIIHFGYVETFAEYARFLWQSDILPVTSNQDFFGGSIVEAMYCACTPLLPNRLAYPQHLKANHQSCLYETDDEYRRRLADLIHGFEQSGQNLQAFVAHYDWKKCIGTYDQAFLNV